ncbi:MAG: transglutaminase domain-containing protein, partial [Dehalococcoidia bacterium]|nr:transglutaminase domain-containing protein [Dehalococcoidia bacterium]
RSLTESANNPFDKATAIESYLRSFTYSTSLPTPPGNVDRVDYMLFTIRKGYSAYFSTTMTVMLRTLGIPARLATGYSIGNLDPERGAYLVKESNAHGWVEVFFPRYGWIEFEPTPSLPPMSRPSLPIEGLSDEDLFLKDQVEELPEESPQEDIAITQSLAEGWPIWGFGTMALAALSGVLWLVWRQRWTGLDAAVVVYGKISALASLVRQGPRSNQTPREYGAVLQDLLPRHEGAIDSILRAYEKVRYGGQTTSPEEASDLFSFWHTLRLELLRRFWLPWRRKGGQ